MQEEKKCEMEGEWPPGESVAYRRVWKMHEADNLAAVALVQIKAWLQGRGATGDAETSSGMGWAHRVEGLDVPGIIQFPDPLKGSGFCGLRLASAWYHPGASGCWVEMRGGAKKGIGKRKRKNGGAGPAVPWRTLDSRLEIRSVENWMGMGMSWESTDVDPHPSKET